MDQRPKHSDPADDTLSESTVHDLITWLTVIKGQTQMLQRWGRMNDVQDKNAMFTRLDVIDRVVTRLASRVDGLSRPGRDEPSKETDRDDS